MVSPEIQCKKPRYKPHIDGVKVKACFEGFEGKSLRYTLEITSTKVKIGKTACVVMLNPSHANECKADCSVRFMEEIIFCRELRKELDLPEEFDEVRRLIVVNLFALVKTNNFKTCEENIGAGNDCAIKAALKQSDIVILGWGCSKRAPIKCFRKRQAIVLNRLLEMMGEQKQVFQTKRHPAARRGREHDFIEPLSHQKLSTMLSELVRRVGEANAEPTIMA
jgi:hypothetical protein